MKLLVVGRGWTGKKVFQQLQQRNHTVELVSHQQVFDAIANNTYDWVVNCAGVTGVPNVDACEQQKEVTMMGNSVFPILLYEACNKLQQRLAHFSSGCIYQGVIDSEDAEPNFFGSTYSISKGLSDSYLKNRSVVFRIRMPFTAKEENKNLLTKLKRYAAGGKLAHSGENSLTDHDEAIRVACELLEAGVENAAYNLVNQGSINNYEIAKLLGIENAEWFEQDEFVKATAAARSTCVIPAYYGMRDVRTALESAIKSYTNQ